MKKLRVIGKQNLEGCETKVKRCVETVDGLEEAHINMSTGEITYGPGGCTDEQLLREAFAKEGLELEEAK